MKLLLSTIFILSGALACAANEWQPLNGSEIELALTNQTLEFEFATQKFYESGRTLYKTPQDSWGYWRVLGSQYCSQWPPVTGWDCYAVFQDHSKTEVRFISGKDITVGYYP